LFHAQFTSKHFWICYIDAKLIPQGSNVILITRLNGSKIYINAELIKSVEPTPDAVITLDNGEKYIARETAEVVVDRIIEYQRKIHTQPVELKQAGE
jgi:flagellar protein FlbD